MIKNYFRSFKIFTEKEIEDFLPFFEIRKLRKNDYFVQEGEWCKEIAFIESGIFRSYYISNEGKDITYCFRFPNELIASYSSFISGKASVENMQAISEASLLVLKKNKIEELVNKNANWILFLKLIAEQEYLELEKRFFQLQRDSATERYDFLLKNQPGYVREIPLQYLASYLGITQRHLSRIRKKTSF
ncbi:Crp/Fnr family transcriptional regulator [Chryseobacterium tongliaoense]|uniref:Crp/Fnr family transcriptional regulator n=1 Tax=Chryseobacterium tongliaoense TaxID=3240933 RepID=UPI00351212CA